MYCNLWISQLHNALHGTRELAILVYQEVLDVVVHAAHAGDHHLRPPDHAIQHGGQQLRSISSKLLHDVRVPFEELIKSVVIPGTIGAECHQVSEHHLGSFQVSHVYRHEQRRHRLGTYGNIKNPGRPFSSWGIRQCTPHLLGVVGVYGLHDQCCPLFDRPNQELGNQTKGPSEGISQVVVTSQLLEGLRPTFNKRLEKVSRDPVADVTQSKGRDEVNSGNRILV
mmetsp:Transcript_38322/g.88623  ORF Transcript_38322/g.88623 Transcript_38322/m.88623 type:complete len:225 (-) Transcript_38322:1851-2525(-)